MPIWSTFVTGRWLSGSVASGGALSPGSLEDSVVSVSHFEPTDPVQVEAKKRVLDFCEEHPDALYRSCEPGHLTASCWVVDHVGRRGLVLLHAKIGRWLQPGGHADGEGRLVEVALKEAEEETGIAGLEVWSEPLDVDVHLFVNRHRTEPDHLHFDVRYLVRAPEGAVAVTNHESEGYRWITLDEIDDEELGLDESTRRLARQGFELASRLCAR